MNISDSRWMIYKPGPLWTEIRGILLNALAYSEGSQREAAKLLGITPRVFNYMMCTYDIPTPLARKSRLTARVGMSAPPPVPPSSAPSRP
jgi:regulatory Fis family protein